MQMTCRKTSKNKGARVEYLDQMRYRVVILILAGMATGCMPWPHSLYLAPAVEGVVTHNGLPVENAEISVSARNRDERQKSVTDSNGYFITKPIRTLELFISFPSDPLISYSVTISTAGKPYQGLDEFFVGYGPEKISVTCELSRPAQLLKGQQYCVRSRHE